jgi:hypothetical protein
VLDYELGAEKNKKSCWNIGTLELCNFFEKEE